MWIDNDFPKLLGAELYRPHPAYIIEMAVEPVVVHDFSKQLWSDGPTGSIPLLGQAWYQGVP